ncbi:hypothetical protein MLD38_003654 [Melastoma candidum]|uniref:Uncharacterized protein n=1 Tax=Melastoma candidum TaxID=119954 RepID=A0ACB9SBT9_9MYRT|nr:hypothetical protein MLD38_003654 [Melastoma candidum]
MHVEMVEPDWKQPKSKRSSSSSSSSSAAVAALPPFDKKSPRPSNNLRILFPPIPSEVTPASSSACSAYEHYLRLPELIRMFESRNFPHWKSETVLKPALIGLELTFRFISTVLSDPRPYSNCREWINCLESLAVEEVLAIARMVENEEEGPDMCGAAPVVELSRVDGVLARDGSSSEVWKVPREESPVVSRISKESLLPRLLSWHKSEGVARRVACAVECAFMRCSYTLGIGEPNLMGKPNLDYDGVCRPSEIQLLKRNPYDQIDNHENQSLYTIHQLVESWTWCASSLLKRILERIGAGQFEAAERDCHIVERIWKLLVEIEDLHLLMDPEDFLKLKNKLDIRSEDAAFCFRSTALVEMARACKDLRHCVPEILGVEADPMGGPRVQEAAMTLYGNKAEFRLVHLLQAMQAIEAALKRFFFAYRQVLVMMVGSLEARESSRSRAGLGFEVDDSLSRVFLEPTYFPSLDAAKTFLWESLRRGV